MGHEAALSSQRRDLAMTQDSDGSRTPRERESQAVEGRFGHRLEQNDHVADVEGCILVDRSGKLVDGAAEGRVFPVFFLRHAIRRIVDDHPRGQRQGGRVSAQLHPRTGPLETDMLTGERDTQGDRAVRP